MKCLNWQTIITSTWRLARFKVQLGHGDPSKPSRLDYREGSKEGTKCVANPPECGVGLVSTSLVAGKPELSQSLAILPLKTLYSILYSKYFVRLYTNVSVISTKPHLPTAYYPSDD
jgi:hypothetical protein